MLACLPACLRAAAWDGVSPPAACVLDGSFETCIVSTEWSETEGIIVTTRDKR